ncbi:MAG: TolC family protein [Cyclobacteriaceae bacterium]|nr:TolC family protein [Cyclobacteriaceae bacterium]MCH8517672.1 TolC family protein [Cyclobacteriaceae bacterium]
MKVKVIIFLIFWSSVELHAQNLSQMQESLDAHPRLRMSDRAIDRAEAVKDRASVLPDPKLSATIGGGIHTMNGTQLGNVSLMQPIPFWGSLKQNKRLADSEIGLRNSERDLTRESLHEQFQYRYLDLYIQQKRIAISERALATLVRLEELTLQNVEQGKLSATAWLEVSIREEELEQQLKNQRTTFQRDKESLGTFLAWDEDTFEPDFQEELSDQLGELIEADRMNSPLVNQALQEVQVMKDRATLREKDRYPNFEIGLTYMIVNDRVMGESLSGNNMLMPMVGMSLPIYRKRTRSQIREERMGEMQSQARVEDIMNELDSEWIQLVGAREVAQANKSLYERQIDRIERLSEITEGQLTSGKAGLKEMLDLVLMRIAYENKLLDAYLAEEQAIIRMRALVGQSGN